MELNYVILNHGLDASSIILTFILYYDISILISCYNMLSVYSYSTDHSSEILIYCNISRSPPFFDRTYYPSAIVFFISGVLKSTLPVVDVFYELKLTTVDSSLTIYPKRCYATPTSDPHHKIQYDLIKNGWVYLHLYFWISRHRLMLNDMSFHTNAPSFFSTLNSSLISKEYPSRL